MHSNSGLSESHKKGRGGGGGVAGTHPRPVTPSPFKAKDAESQTRRALRLPSGGRQAGPPHYRITSKALCVPRLISSRNPPAMLPGERLRRPAQEAAALPAGAGAVCGAAARHSAAYSSAPVAAAGRRPWGGCRPPSARPAVGSGCPGLGPVGSRSPEVEACTICPGSRSSARPVSRGFLTPSPMLLRVNTCLSPTVLLPHGRCEEPGPVFSGASPHAAGGLWLRVPPEAISPHRSPAPTVLGGIQQTWSCLLTLSLQEAGGQDWASSPRCSLSSAN